VVWGLILKSSYFITECKVTNVRSYFLDGYVFVLVMLIFLLLLLQANTVYGALRGLEVCVITLF
jgi:hypothetical protein